MACTLHIAQKANPVAYGPLATALWINSLCDKSISILAQSSSTLEKYKNSSVALETEWGLVVDTVAITRLLARKSVNASLFGANPLEAVQIEGWVDFAAHSLTPNNYATLAAGLDQLDHHFKLRSYMVGFHLSIADIAIWGALRASPIFLKNLKSEKGVGLNLARWFNFISSLPFALETINTIQTSTEEKKVKKDQGSFDIGLKDAEMGKVVTRFPPEPSGYLHIGHAKAALLNQYFAQAYKGKLIVRFDDTNPSKEKVEFEESIKEDLALIGVKGDVVTHTSDYFETILKYADKLIKAGLAYVDDTDQETMRSQRMDGIDSCRRSRTIEENLAFFKEMCEGTEVGLTSCLRAKMDMQAKNKAMRDPVIYRCNLIPHHLTGTKYKVYPTYDFACPIVDSVEGVTHALRTNEYRDRNPQYEWFLEKLELRKVHIWDYSRVNFVYTLLSKRKLQLLVDAKRVEGWDDPRFPTIRGIRRRGMTIEALKNYILMQGASTHSLLLEWDKVWALNKKVIDPIAPRFVALNKEKLCKVKLLDGPKEIEKKSIPKQKKNPEVGMKTTSFFHEVYLDYADASDLVAGEEVTFMDWGNVIIQKTQLNSSGIPEIEAVLHLEGDFKKTKKKLTWLAATPELVPCILLDYDYLITKKKLEEEDKLEDFLTEVSEFKVEAVGDANLSNLNKGDIIQLERRGYYICDQAMTSTKCVHLISIPDGKAASMASKATK